VVLHNGAPLEMPWLGSVRGLLEMYLGGDAVGGAAVDILFGRANPSGRLPETFPIKLEDNPSWLNFPGEGDRVEYREGVFVGYRYYDKKKMEVLFPFGFGLSYTTFQYSNLRLGADTIRDTDILSVAVEVTNTGRVPGKEVVLLFVAGTESGVIRPPKELKGFSKVSLLPGETKTVTFELGKRTFAYYSAALGDWHVESGAFEIIIAKSAAEPVLSKTVAVESTVRIPRNYTPDTIFLDIKKDARALALVEPLLKSSMFGSGDMKSETETATISPEMMAAMIDYMPLRGLLSFGGATPDDLRTIVDQLNGI
jgi:beta-glucosidase